MTNAPSYNNSAVASLVITFVSNLSCSLIQRHRSLFAGNIGNFTTTLRVPHSELMSSREPMFVDR